MFGNIYEDHHATKLELGEYLGKPNQKNKNKIIELRRERRAYLGIRPSLYPLWT